jgi:hypothetical protein
MLKGIHMLYRASRDNVVGMATGYGMDDRGVGIRVQLGLHVVQAGSRAHPASSPMRTGGSFPGGKATRAWNWPLLSN